MIFADRTEAGRQLAGPLLDLRAPAPVVLALPRGGLPVAAEVARALDAPLDLLLSRKIAAPWQPELALGAAAEGSPPTVVWNEEVLAQMGLGEDAREPLLRAALGEMERRRELYVGKRGRVPLGGRTAILVDDGVATGATIKAAARAARLAGAKRVVLAFPVAAEDALQDLKAECDDIVCLSTPSFFPGVGAFYRDFPQLSDEEVFAILEAFGRKPEAPGGNL